MNKKEKIIEALSDMVNEYQKRGIFKVTHIKG